MGLLFLFLLVFCKRDSSHPCGCNYLHDNQDVDDDDANKEKV
uniref:Uncharacterized protein n=1 Tax=Rhizophora mucronata TaxID=61149 RepID=A0A2P2QDR0_RHIMU